MILSASSPESLERNAKDLSRYLLEIKPKPILGDVSFTLSRKRKHNAHVLVTSASDVESFARDLATETQGFAEKPKKSKSVVLAFGGQTKKTVGLSRSVYESYSQFKHYIDECNRIVMELGCDSILDSMFQEEPLSSIVALQCGTFAMQYASAKCWIDGGLQVDSMIGHSFGELTAMVVSGTLSLHDGLKLISHRAFLMGTKWGHESGVMYVVHSSLDVVQTLLTTINGDSAVPEIEIACFNSPKSHVVVGSHGSIDRVEDVMRTDKRFSGVKGQRLDVTHGFHSQFTENILEDLDECSASLTYRTPDISLESCTQDALGPISANRSSQHAREPVYFANAVQRIEKRLGPCMWLEAGMNSSIVPMVMRAVDSTGNHSFQPMKVPDSSDPHDSMCDVTMSLWREGISASYWSFIGSQEQPYGHIWLPPYQFQKSKHWLPNIDRAIEAQQNSLNHQEAVREAPEMPKPRPVLVRIKPDSNKEDRKEFSMCLDAERFTKIVSGHSVRQRPLCPASMYMECTAMAVQILQGHIELGTLRFRNLSFQAALGVDSARQGYIELQQLRNGQEWSFVVKSSDPRGRTSVHAKGEIAITAQADCRVYEGLISDRIDEIRSRAGSETLTSHRAYGLFSRVVHYANFFHGISRITLEKNEAIADVDIADDAKIEFDQSTMTNGCETVAIDAFIQVVGLLINSSSMVSHEDVYVATGITSAVMSSECNFDQCRSWTVYAKYNVTGEGQAAGEVFVMTREGTLAMVITGAQFSRLSILKLERLLDSVNTKPVSEPIKKGKVESLEPSPSSEDSSPGRSLDGEDRSGASTPPSSVPSRGESPDKKPDPGRRQTVFKLLSETTGAPVDSISGKPQLQELGIDSLSAVELKGDLEDAFDIEIEDDRFTLESTVQEILDFLGCGADAPAKTPSDDSKPRSPSPTKKEPVGSSTHVPENVNKMELANPGDAIMQIEEGFDQAASKRGFLGYHMNVAPVQDQLLLAYICEAFRDLGTDLNETAQGDEVELFSYLPKHDKVMNRLLEILEKHDILTRQSSKIDRSSGQLPTSSSQDLHKRFVAQFPAYESEAQLMALTGPKLADCLTGKANAVGIMFKDDNAQKVMGNYYIESPMLSTLTEHMVGFFEKLLSASPRESASASLRILEVGAGFGGTTTRLAEVLQASGVSVSYKFTDVSPSLVKAAKSKFQSYPWMEFQSLNLEKDVPEDLKGKYDVVIGTNCVHATTDKAKTIGRLKALLNEQGFIVLSEVTQLVDWYDIVFGMLEGWWLAKDGSSYPLQPPESWVRSFEQAGFPSGNITYSSGSSPESNTQRLLVASNKHEVSATSHSQKAQEKPRIQSVVYKEVEDVRVEADVFLPTYKPAKPMPVAIMIHGGGHMTLSRKAVRPVQTELLLKKGVLPISIDYRLCPEISLTHGPIKDVCDAYAWVRRGGLQDALHGQDIAVDGSSVVVVGWSSGGHLAMTTAWTSKDAGLPPPRAILSFYGPTDFESGDLDVRRAEEYPERRLSMEKIISSLPTKPLTGYSAMADSSDSAHLGWLRPGDPRSELVLSLFKEGNGLPLMLNGIRPDPSDGASSSGSTTTSFSPPSASSIAAVSPLAHLRQGAYTTPTFLIHGTRDEIVPFRTAETFADTLKAKGVKGGLAAVKNVRHIHDLKLVEGDDGWWQGVGVGYDFLFRELGLYR
ncbi:MAG: hypothetical protein M1828_002375 [Chrysothrix sp. TS-e1954]|nr:MAG: hypothetical protein M1828_002375 [Chrysothrix sp. TS-e1954]